MLGIRRIILISLVLFIFGLNLGSSNVHGCFVKDNDYGVELIIVKPGVTLNLSRLLEIWEDVSIINYTFNGYSGEAVAYKSPCNSNYGFIIGFIKINGGVYPVFTVKPLFKYNMGRDWWCSSFSIENYVSRDTIVDTASSLGWRIADEYHTNLYMTITPSPNEPNVLESIVIGVQDIYELWKDIGNATIHVSIVASNATDEKHTGLIIEASDLNDNVKNAVEELLYSLFNQEVELEWQRCSPSTYNPDPDKLREDLRHVLTGELEFLIDIEALKGITKEDAVIIAQYVVPGLTGLNGTLVFNGERMYRLSDYLESHGLSLSCSDGIVVNESNIGYYTVLPIHPCIYFTATPIPSTTTYMHFDTYNPPPSTSSPSGSLSTSYIGAGKRLSNIEALAIAFIIAVLVASISWAIIYRRR